jgi:hypothetical protein
VGIRLRNKLVVVGLATALLLGTSSAPSFAASAKPAPAPVKPAPAPVKPAPAPVNLSSSCVAQAARVIGAEAALIGSVLKGPVAAIGGIITFVSSIQAEPQSNGYFLC